MSEQRTILGVDVGSVSVGLVEIDQAGRPRARAYAAHCGDIRGTLERLLRAEPLQQVGWLATTGAAARWLRATKHVDSHVAHIAAAGHQHGRLAGILLLGGERFSLIRFDEQGRYDGTRTNSSCAAGTGSFLDQQALGLGLADSTDLARRAMQCHGPAPRIASRCAVFAKTDLIHAQQQGYPLEAICDGLCDGLAAIVADSVLGGELDGGPLLLVGGVALNPAVRQHLSQRIERAMVVDEAPHLHGALGAALRLRANLAESGAERPSAARAAADWLREAAPAERATVCEPLDLELPGYPSFVGERRDTFVPQVVGDAEPVEVDVYHQPTSTAAVEVWLGVDIGSTSTKAVLIDGDRRVLLGLYTRTAGRPLVAAQALLEAIDHFSAEVGASLHIRGASTTGAGRQFIAAVLGADLVVDEITAHARAAVELEPATDTIIEIGGQDAKFTTLRNGRVTSAVMNTVCAAGTGSFIEEQARRLDCPVESYAEAVKGAKAPLASDRCTVFMQRDVSYLLHAGFSRAEVLATVLHSVRENYLRKVARESSIGQRVCFQGATAKNRALVAAFQQRLGRRIFVSRYCHLTGALGAALMVAEQQVERSVFRGVGLHAETIAVGSERCELCRNECTITTAQVRGEVAAYGFRCGRDYQQERYVSRNRAGFDLLRARRRCLSAPEPPGATARPLIGIPAALQLFDQLPLWRRFFAELGVRTITSEQIRDPVRRGKELARAEFCAPMMAFHGHVAELAERADYLFVPVTFEGERPDRRSRRQYCYYTQYAGALIGTMGIDGLDARCLRPLVDEASGVFPSTVQLYEALRPVLGTALSFGRVAAAYQRARAHAAARRAELGALMGAEHNPADGIAVVLLGRPYACLAPQMNKGIPDLIAAQGVKAFYHDMLRYDPEEVAEIEGLLGEVHWQYASQILAAAEVTARREGLYPVLVTSFKCTPDSCTTEYVKRVLDRHGKPYLILELDEHDSSLGYETRIEAAIRAFRNHHDERRQAAQRRDSWRGRAPKTVGAIGPRRCPSLADKTLFLPSWDRLSCSLIAANLNRVGIRTVLLEENELVIHKSQQLNSGQCAPLTIIAQTFIDAVESRGLDPSRAVLWMLRSQLACNIGMFAMVWQALFEDYGHGFEKASVYIGDLTLYDLSMRAIVDTYLSYMFGGHLRKMACRLRPYEVHAGATDRAVDLALGELREAFGGRGAKMDALTRAVDRFVAIETRGPRNRPKVAIFGDLYTRDNAVASQDLVRFIERHGGEVVTTPYTDYVKLIASSYFAKWLREGKLLDVVVNRSLLTTGQLLERRYGEQFARVLGPLVPARLDQPIEQVLAPYGVTPRHTGESFDNLLKVAHVLQCEPDVSLFVQAVPAYCCPALITEAMADRIEEVTGVPVVTIVYDGTTAPKNDVLVPYLTYPRRRARGRPAQAG